MARLLFINLPLEIDRCQSATTKVGRKENVSYSTGELPERHQPTSSFELCRRISFQAFLGRENATDTRFVALFRRERVSRSRWNIPNIPENHILLSPNLMSALLRGESWEMTLRNVKIFARRPHRSESTFKWTTMIVTSFATDRPKEAHIYRDRSGTHLAWDLTWHGSSWMRVL